MTILFCGTIGAEPPESVRVSTSVGEYIVSVYGYPDFGEDVPRSLLKLLKILFHSERRSVVFGKGCNLVFGLNVDNNTVSASQANTYGLVLDDSLHVLARVCGE